jgi:hypothetical protein
MEPTKTCSCGENHQGHLCVLKGKGMTTDIEHLTDNPAVACFICGAEANSEENVYSPIPL